MRIQRQERDLNVLETAEGDLQAATAGLAARGVTGTGGRVTERLARATARYTVESERAIHRSTTGTGAGVRPAIGNAGRTAGGMGPPATPASGQDFGDNVELF
jgi:hypothetical protein